jgi:hypothetical protein
MAASIPTAVRRIPACSTAPAAPPCPPRAAAGCIRTEVWVRDPRKAERSGFKLRNKHRPQANKAF